MKPCSQLALCSQESADSTSVLERAGMRVIWHSEIDPYASAVLKKHWPHVPNLGDVRDITNAPAVELVCGGFPCQPYSLAGKRLGVADERDLWPEFSRIVSELDPRWVVAENVGGAVESTLDRCCRDLEAEGYETAAIVFPASAVGAEHKRERLFIVAHLAGERMEGMRTEGQQVARALDGALLPLRDRDGQWTVEPDFCRAADGFSRRVDRLRCLGNAIVPQIAEIIGRAIVSAA